jgi:hypothetical protein
MPHEEEEAAAFHALLFRMESPLEGLALVTEVRQTLARVERLLVREARLTYYSWDEIGAALGISRQAAHRRHRPFVNRPGGL